MSLTSTQQTAIRARGNVLVVAGAGTGKTRTLVERCLNCLVEEQPPASLDEILMVTFTEAAAAEMRQRIRGRLEEERQRDLGNAHWREQLALFETAHIGTLHSFCLELVRQHFYELELDPQLAVLPDEEARLLADETLDGLLQEHYAGKTSAAEAVQELIQSQAQGWDKPIRALVLRVHHYTQTLPDPAGWFSAQLDRFASPEPAAWQGWLFEALGEWRGRWLPVLERAAGGNEIAAECAAALRQLEPKPTRAQAAIAFESVVAAGRGCPVGKKTLWLKPLKEFLGETEFLRSLTAPVGDPGSKREPPACADKGDGGEHSQAGGSVDPLVEDWNWVRGQMGTLLELVREFGAAYTQAKRELGMVDFHDLEQYALRLLWDARTNQMTRVARQWRQQLRYVFVDEYQDINAAQDKIIEALSREGPQANRFLVGDVKQSIYRFRLANPHIFQGYVEAWQAGPGQVIALAENFRSREGLLDFMNSLFGLLMQRELGGVEYDARAQLRFGAAAERPALSVTASPEPRVELHWRVKGNAAGLEEDDESAEALAQVSELAEADKEARLVAMRLREVKAAQHPVWDEAAAAFRPVGWSDMAVLLRAPANKSESYAKEFARVEIPLQVARGGFYESTEVTDLLSLLQLLDNPLQDLPLLAVLHSPLVGLTLDELAAIRLAVKGPYWTALVLWHEAQGRPAGMPGASGQGQTAAATVRAQLELPLREATYRKVTRFLGRYGHWRRLARQVSLARCLEAVLTETHYAEWLLTQAHGAQRHLNVQRLLGLALEFDQFQHQSLFRFLRFIEAQQVAETEPEVATVNAENCVRLLSIHQSKGLEFPVVVVADLGKAFNESDLRAEVILDEAYGLCPQIKPPQRGDRYPSLPYWLARQRQHREMLGEELRLLYVALTRARDTLILSGTISAAQWAQFRQAGEETGAARLLAARSYADWVGGWFGRNCAPGADATRRENGLVRWFIRDDASLLEAPAATAEAPSETADVAGPEVWARLQQRLLWAYPFLAATRRPAKASVTTLRRAAEPLDEEAAPMYEMPSGMPGRPWPGAGLGQALAGRESRRAGGPRLRSAGSAAEVGNMHHVFLQLVRIEHTGSLDELKEEARRLRQEGALTAEDLEGLDFEALAGFWQSDLGRQVRAQAQDAHRELAFTARFAPREIAALTGEAVEANLEDEFVVVQGVVDLAVVGPQEIWLIDFKTDAVEPNELEAKAKVYAPQVRLYARALSQIYRRPVSAGWLYFLAPRSAVRVDTGFLEGARRH